MAEWNDVYDENRRLTGRRHLRGTPWAAGDYGLVVCVWVYDGRGKLLLTRRAPEKTAAGTWENSGGAAQAGETSCQAIARELREETGISASEQEFRLLRTVRDGNLFFDHYCLRRRTPLSEIRLQPGETDGVRWVTFPEVHALIRRGAICDVIGRQFLEEEPALLALQTE